MSSTYTTFSFATSKVVTVASIAAAAFIGYCIYFDKKRRSAPDYKQRIRENRRAAARAAESHADGLPNFTMQSEIQAYFLHEMQLGEELLSNGHAEEGIDHLCLALALCGDSMAMLQVFRETLQPDQFEMLMRKLPEAKQRIAQKRMNEQAATISALEQEAMQGLIDTDDLE